MNAMEKTGQYTGLKLGDLRAVMLLGIGDQRICDGKRWLNNGEHYVVSPYPLESAKDCYGESYEIVKEDLLLLQQRNASEIMMELRRTHRALVTLPFKFDRGSLEEQLWEEQGFYHSMGKGVLVSMRRMLEYHADYYDFECVEIMDDGMIRHWIMKGTDCVHVDPEHYEEMLEKRAESKIDPPMMFTDGRLTI